MPLTALALPAAQIVCHCLVIERERDRAYRHREGIREVRHTDNNTRWEWWYNGEKRNSRQEEPHHPPPPTGEQAGIAYKRFSPE